MSGDTAEVLARTAAEYPVKPIGLAVSHPRTAGDDPRQDRYHIFAVEGDMLQVEYIGYSIEGVVYGLPLGGPRWSPPVRFASSRHGFRSVTMFEGNQP